MDCDKVDQQTYQSSSEIFLYLHMNYIFEYHSMLSFLCSYERAGAEGEAGGLKSVDSVDLLHRLKEAIIPINHPFETKQFS